MSTENWDPLEPLEGNLATELVSTTIKRQIKNILKSYTGWFDPFSELIQNALDAMDNKAARYEEFTRRLWIQIDINENTLSVTDNGIGFTEDRFRSFLAPNVSFKTQANRGNKGVGATYLAYGFNFLQVGTKTPDYEFIGTLRDGRAWVEDEENVELRPKVKPENEPLHSVFRELDRGSTFTLKLIGESIRPQKLNWLGADTAKQWSAILRIKTPLGGIYFGEKPSTIQCTLRVIDENGAETSENLENCEYSFPHTVISNCRDVDEIRAEQYSLYQQGKDLQKLSPKFFKLNGLYKYWNTDSFISKEGGFSSRLKDSQKKLVDQYKLKCYGFFCYTTRIWDSYNDTTIEIRKGERILRGGLQLATNTMPQGDLILIPLTRSIGYQHVAHVVIHLDQADPDLGRKGFQPEIENLSKYISTLIVTYFLGWREHLRPDTGNPPDIVEKKKIHDWIHELEEHEEKNPLVITREDVFLPLMKPSMTAKPLNEQDVISLFNQFLAGGVIRGIRLMATSQHNQYDSVFRLCLNEPFENYVFDRHKNPLGLESSQASREYVSEPRILEYKYSVDALLEELDKETKDEQAIDLVVAWDSGKEWQTIYNVTSLLHYENLHHRIFHGCTHLFYTLRGHRAFSAIILSELIDYVNDPDSVQEYQSTTYGT